MKEPISIELEQPTVVSDVLHVHLHDHHHTMTELANTAFLRSVEEFTERFGCQGGTGGLRIVI